MLELPLSPTIEWLNREQAAEYIFRRCGVPISAQALASKASEGTGPPYRIWSGHRPSRGGRGRFAVYRPADLDVWMDQQIHEVRRSA